jgi:DnaJ-class molecular chaperone
VRLSGTKGTGSGVLRAGSTDMAPREKIYVEATCGHCGGLGCIYCNRTGTVFVAAPKRPCPYCDGVGCIYCGFTGWAEPKGKYD